jgi:hypothetical protein
VFQPAISGERRGTLQVSSIASKPRMVPRQQACFVLRSQQTRCVP